MFRLALVLLVASSVVLAAIPLSDTPITTPDDLIWDDHQHLGANYILVTEHEACTEAIRNVLGRREDFSENNLHVMRSDFAALFPNLRVEPAPGMTSCNAISLERGAPREQLSHVIPERLFLDALPVPHNDQDVSDLYQRLRPWVDDVVMKVEVGFLNWAPNPAKIYWVDIVGGRKMEVAVLERREKNTQWQTTTLGHHFEVRDSVTDELLLEVVAKHPMINVIGSPIGDECARSPPKEQLGHQIRTTLEGEWWRAGQVERTFTELGFAKAKLPEDLFVSIRTYYYNNRHQLSLEEWEGKGPFVNWWEVEVFMISMPWALKAYWQTRLLPLVEAWAGERLELTDMYGMRRYEHGARLLTHVDRESTHAASLIINVAQIAMNKPWMLEIYDFAGRLHEIPMDEGDIVYYESARCLHGRMKALDGAAYINLFSHYRPVGDPDWYKRRNPDYTPPQLHDPAAASEPVQALFDKSVSPSGQKLKGGDSLWEYWVATAQDAARTHGLEDASAYMPNSATSGRR